MPPTEQLENPPKGNYVLRMEFYYDQQELGAKLRELLVASLSESPHRVLWKEVRG